ncbi:MAG TPA: TonB-dependent receptor [Caulobacteraceae bacterium]|jgi:iron complex outermembrane receptor protein
MKLLLVASAAALAAACAQAAHADDDAVAPVVVTARPLAALATTQPVTTETVTNLTVSQTINAFNVEDALKYLPDVFVRKRHIGDTQAPIATRTSGVGSSARSLIYADDVLLSALIGNNNSSASPRWSFVSPQEIERIDVLYGPFAAAYPGNSIGEVVNIVTRMPTHLEAGIDAVGGEQAFSQYGTHQNLGSGEISGYVGDRIGPTAFWLSAEHLDTHAQPLGFATLAQPTGASAAGAPVTGAFPDLNRTGQPIEVLGATSIEHQVQDNLKLKVAVDLTPRVTATYSVGLFHNQDDATAQTYLTSAAGAAVYSGQVNIAGKTYTIPASAFSSGVYDYEELHVGQSLKIASHSGGAFDWELVGTLYNFARDKQGIPSGALPAAASGGAGTLTDMAGTGWGTLDAKGVWHSGAHELSFGLHGDEFVLANDKFNTADWTGQSEGSLASAALGRTATLAAWAQDAWAITPALSLTTGVRLEDWQAWDGVNVSAAPALDAVQPRLAHERASPKAQLAWTPAPGWRLSASYGEAYRFPTVSELYQSVTVGTVLAVPNPNLSPEQANSAELTAERDWTGGSLRLSGFAEWVKGALLSQTAPLTPGSATLVSFVQNIDQTRVLGVEAVVRQDDVLVKGLDVFGAVTYADPRVDADAAFPSAVGAQLIGVPKWRVTATASWQATPRLSLSGAVRYSSRTWATINDADLVTHTYQGFDPYLVADLRATYQVTPHVMAAMGVDNVGADSYFIFHPFPQRTVTAELRWTL